MQPITGKIAYHAGVSGTVSLLAAEKMIGMWCVATGAGATVSLGGGDAMPLPPNIPFAMGLESFAEEFVGPIDIVFTATASYIVKTKKKF